MLMLVEVFTEKCRKNAVIPEYSRLGDAGMDICAAEEVLIKPGETAIIPTGLKIAVPEGYEIQVRPRSGISLRTPLRITNSPGTIDSGYRDELGIIMSNTSPICCSGEEEILSIDCWTNKNGTYVINPGDRVAQIVLCEIPLMRITEVDSIRNIGYDRGGGFGSTGLFRK
jgi:dUTP pyrophosphatase